MRYCFRNIQNYKINQETEQSLFYSPTTPLTGFYLGPWALNIEILKDVYFLISSFTFVVVQNFVTNECRKDVNHHNVKVWLYANAIIKFSSSFTMKLNLVKEVKRKTVTQPPNKMYTFFCLTFHFSELCL